MNIVSRAICRVVAVLVGMIGILNIIDAIYASTATSAATENLSMSATIGESVTIELSGTQFELNPKPSSSGTFASTSSTPFTIGVYTNSSTGFNINMTTEETSLKSGSDSIATLDSSYASEGVSENDFPIDRWGYSVVGMDVNYYPIANTNSIGTYARPASDAANGKQVQVNFGVKLSLETAPGTYTGTLNFTATAVSGGQS